METQLPKVVERLGDFEPIVDPVAMVRALLACVPPEYLNGLDRVVLSHTSTFARTRRRQQTYSRGHKVLTAQSRGMYHAAYKGEPAWIEIIVDNVLPERAAYRWIGALVWPRWLGDYIVSEVLYHELGHHIHRTLKPEHREQEDIADEWQKKLTRAMMRSRHGLALKLISLAFAIGLGKLDNRLVAQMKRKDHAVS